MSKTKICFLLGYSKAGKDEVAEVFKSNGFTRVGFADKVKSELAEKLGIDVKVLHEQGSEKEALRPKMIEYAESERAKDPLVWLKKALQTYEGPDGKLKRGLKLVISDCRRIDEIYWLHDIKNYIKSIKDSGQQDYLEVSLFLVERPGAALADDDILTHDAISYAQGINRMQPKFIDGVINNNEDLAVLREKTNKLIDIFDLNVI